MAQLPLYYKNSKPVGHGVSAPSKRWKENYLFLLILVAFVILIVGNLWFVPPTEEEDGYEKVYNEFNPTVITNSNVAPTEPTLKPSRAVEGAQSVEEVERKVLAVAEEPAEDGGAKREPEKEEVDKKEQRQDQETQGQREEEEDDARRRAQEMAEGNPKLGIPPRVVEENGGDTIVQENAQVEQSPSKVQESPAATQAEKVNEERRQKVVEVS